AICMLHGVTLAQVEATPTCGFSKSASLNPTARSMERAGARLTPSTMIRECSRGSTRGRRGFMGARSLYKHAIVDKPRRAVVLSVHCDPSRADFRDIRGIGSSPQAYWAPS